MPPGYGAPPYAAAPNGPPPGYAVQPPPPRPAQAQPPVRAAQTMPPPIVRGQAPETNIPPAKPTPVAMPSPDQLGVAGRTADGGCDWSAIHRWMRDLGVGSFQMDRLNGDVYQFTCMMPTADAGRTHRIEAHGATEAEAVRRALDEARRWREQGR